VEGRDLTSGTQWKQPRAWGLTARSRNPTHGSDVAESAVPAREGAWRLVCSPVKPVGEPDAVNLHVRFDEGEVQTEHGVASEAPADERAGKLIGYT
jgi:hypothetical protein